MHLARNTETSLSFSGLFKGNGCKADSNCFKNASVLLESDLQHVTFEPLTGTFPFLGLSKCFVVLQTL